MSSDEKKAKHAAYMRDYIKRFPEKKKTARRKYRGKRKEMQLKVKYNLTMEEYNIMLMEQEEACSICFSPETVRISKGDGVRSLAVDHDHKTGKVRSLLCNRCNTLLGRYENNRELFSKFEEYIKKHGEINGG